MTENTGASALNPVIIAELDRLASLSPDGSLEAASVLDAARPPESVLHAQFTWDDEEAAEAHRLNQARSLIRRYKVRVTYQEASGEERDVLVRGFVAASSVGEVGRAAGTYLPAAGLSGQARNLLLQRMQREIRSLRVRYGHLQEFWALVDEIRAENEPSNGSAAASG
ncbi:MAG TPA: hypothetical protein VGH54_19865 [Mycobacterium sp.]|uniref:hypothetical protein n=1 Tax=Mycobacterium sp. TaxID=1785 RepID=UPI002F3E71D6